MDNINYFQNKVAIERLSEIIKFAERAGLLSAILLAFISILITFNTVRLAIYTARDEIAVMRLVGASSSYARGPFVVEGALSGALAALITLAIFYPLTYWLGPLSENFFSGLNVLAYYRANFLQILVIIAGSGILLGALSSFLAVKKYLRV